MRVPIRYVYAPTATPSPHKRIPVGVIFQVPCQFKNSWNSLPAGSVHSFRESESSAECAIDGADDLQRPEGVLFSYHSERYIPRRTVPPVSGSMRMDAPGTVARGCVSVCLFSRDRAGINNVLRPCSGGMGAEEDGRKIWRMGTDRMHTHTRYCPAQEETRQRPPHD